MNVNKIAIFHDVLFPNLVIKGFDHNYNNYGHITTCDFNDAIYPQKLHVSFRLQDHPLYRS